MAFRLSFGAAVLILAAGSGSAALAQTQQQQAAQCVLDAIKGTRSSFAVQKIRDACNDLAMNTGYMYERQRAYDWCLIQNLSGAQSNAAAIQIHSACRAANPL